MSNRTAYASIPRLKDQRKDISALTQTAEVLTGVKGDGLDKALTNRDMIEGGFATATRRTIGGRTLVGIAPVSSAQTADKPTVPTGFQALAAFTNAILSWDRALFKGYAYTEIWRAASDDFGLASRIATSIPNVATDPIAMGSSYYYWIRFVNILGEVGPIHDTAGVFAQSAPDIPVLQQALTDSIRESELSATLNARIDQLDSVGGVLDRLLVTEQDVVAAEQDINALEITAGNLATGVNANAAGLTAQDLRITANNDEIAAAALDITAIEVAINDPVTGNLANAGAISSLAVTVTQNGADITSSAQAIVTLQSTVGTNTSSIQTLQTVQSGLTAEYVVKLDVNGYVSGFGLYNGGSSSTFLVHADKFAIGAPGSTGIIPFIVTTTTTTINGQSVPPGVYMDQVFIRNGAIGSLQLGLAVIDDAHINNLSATKITTGTLDTSRLNIDGSTLISISGVLQLGDVLANSIVGGDLDFQNINALNLTVANLSGDVTKSIPFSMASAANLGAGSTTIWAGQIPAPEAAGIGRAPYLIASGWGVFENDDAYRISLHMRVNQAFSAYALGSVVVASSYVVGEPPFNLFSYYYIQVSGNHANKIRSGGTLSVSAVIKGTAVSADYISSTNRTTIWYTPTAGGLAVGNSAVADGGAASMDMVASNFFRSAYDFHAQSFSICGGIDAEIEVSVDVELRMGIYNALYKGIPSSVPATNWPGDQVFGLEGIMMSMR